MALDEQTDWSEAMNEQEVSEQAVTDLAGEREQILEAEIYLDDHPGEKSPETEVEEEQETVKREMLKTAITRIENSARTIADFENVVVCWDKLEKNEARRLRNHEISRGDVPLEFGKAMDGVIIPFSYMEPKWKQIMAGSYLDVIHDCPFELDELVSDHAISKMMSTLKADHKEIFFWHFIRQRSCAEVGRMRGQTDRNIRKTRGVIVRRLQAQMAEVLNKLQSAGYGLTLRQREFLADMKKAALDGGKNG